MHLNVSLLKLVHSENWVGYYYKSYQVLAVRNMVGAHFKNLLLTYAGKANYTVYIKKCMSFVGYKTQINIWKTKLLDIFNIK